MNTYEQQLIDFDAAIRRRDAGMAASLDHAERVDSDWPSDAYAYLCDYAALQRDPWTVEAFRAWASQHGLTDPPDLRAWGGITQRAIKRGVIAKVGYAPAASSNGSPKPVYLSASARAA